jgi:hypothetical protein
MELSNRFQGIDSASLCCLAGRYDNPIPRAGHSLIFSRFAIRSPLTFSSGSLTLMRSFFKFHFSLAAQTLVAQPVVRWAKRAKSLIALNYKIVGVYCTVLRTASCTAHLRLRHSFILPDCIYLSVHTANYCILYCILYITYYLRNIVSSLVGCGVYFSFHKIMYLRNRRLIPKAVRTLKDFTRKLWGLLCSLHFLSTQKHPTFHDK